MWPHRIRLEGISSLVNLRTPDYRKLGVMNYSGKWVHLFFLAAVFALNLHVFKNKLSQT